MADNVEDNILKTLGEDETASSATGVADKAATDDDSSDDSGSKVDTKQSDASDDKGESQLDATVRKAAGEDALPAKAGDKRKTEKPGKQQVGPQDLVDDKGALIAKGGRERRFYETAQREKQRADALTNQLKEVQTKVTAYESSNAIGTQLKLSPQELVTGAHIMASLKADPVAAAKYILTQVQAAGHNIEGIGAGVDMTAVRSMLQEMIAPLTQERESKLQQTKVQQEATEVYNNFVTKYPDARVHETALARLLEQDNTLSPEAAYFKLRSFYAERGLDFNKSLDMLQKEQDAAAATGKSGVRRTTIPSGGTSADSIVPTNEASHRADASTSDIVRSAMRDAGLNVNNL